VRDQRKFLKNVSGIAMREDAIVSRHTIGGSAVGTGGASANDGVPGDA
jgi:hypothetical protein